MFFNYFHSVRPVDMIREWWPSDLTGSNDKCINRIFKKLKRPKDLFT